MKAVCSSEKPESFSITTVPESRIKKPKIILTTVSNFLFA
jgi:hypothetical protein